jgi:hypothetical protein
MRLRWIGWLLAVMVIVPLLGLYLAPGLGLWWADRWYQQQGDGYGIDAERWTFSPFAGELTLHQLTLRHPGHASGEQTQLQQLQLQWHTPSLWQQYLHITDIQLLGLTVQVEQSGDINAPESKPQLMVAGLNLPLAETGESPAAAETAEVAPLAWRVRVDQWQLTPDIRWRAEQAPASAGKVALSLTGQNLTWPLSEAMTHELQLQLRGLNLDGQLTADFNLHIQGQLGAGMSDWQGDVRLSEAALAHSQAPPLALAELSLAQLRWQQAKPQAAELQSLQLEQLRIGDSEQPLLSLASYAVDELALSAEQIRTGWHEYQGLELNLTLDEQGELIGLPPQSQAANEELASAAPEQSVADEPEAQQTLSEPAATESNTPGTSTPSVELVGLRQRGEPSHIELRDASVMPTLEQSVSIKALEVSPLQWQASGLQQPSGLKQPLDFNLELALDDYNRIHSQGKLSTFKREQVIFPQGQLTFTVEQLNLVPYNGYLARAMGYHAERGQLNLQAEVGFDEGQLQGDVDILLRNARFEPENDAVIERVSQQISMPVDTALSLLRDDNGNIRLNVPLSGDLASPDVGLNDLSKQLATLALRTATMHYLKQSLVPYGTLLSLADYAGSKLMAIRLDAVVFSAEQESLNDQQRAQLDKVAAIMQEKTELELKACPQFAKTDAPDNWPALATQRAQWIKQYLAQSQDDNDQTLAARITLCKPELDEQHQVVLGF